MTGSVRSIIEREGNRSNRTYYVSAILTNIETNEILWSGRHNQITKEVRTPNTRL
jgi:hypothetical protein